MDIYRVEFENRLSPEQIREALNILKSNSVRIENLRKYYTAKNAVILNKTKTDSDSVNNKVPIPYARHIPKTVIGYLYSKDPEIVINSTNSANAEADKIRTAELKSLIDSIIALNGGYQKLKSTLRNAVIYGIGYNAIIYDGDNPKLVTLDPAECIQVHSYSLVDSLKVVLRFYQIDDKTYATAFYTDAIVEYNNEFKEVVSTAHPLNAVPVAICNGSDDNLGIAEPVLPLIDALDKVANADLDEIEKFALAIRAVYGVEISKEELKRMDEGRTINLQSDQGSTPKIEYVIREINDTFRGSVKDFLVAHIHKMSGVPDFSDEHFAAVSGIALEYKLLGLETACSDLAENAISCLVDNQIY